MSMQHVAAALERAENVLRRRPDMGLQDDAPATARWEGGTRIVASHANGTQMATDMPCELGGSGDQVTPGWMFRAGLASCAATSIAMHAAAAGIELSALEVRASSRSDTRALLGMAGTDGVRVPSAPCNMQLAVRIAAPGVAPEHLHALVTQACGRSPIPNAVENALPLELRIDLVTT